MKAELSPETTVLLAQVDQLANGQGGKLIETLTDPENLLPLLSVFFVVGSGICFLYLAGATPFSKNNNSTDQE
jgi:hypothetical protein